MIGKVTIVGLGPGDKSYMTAEVSEVIRNASVIIGYKKYISLIPPRPNLQLNSSDNRNEKKRAIEAIKFALNGKDVVIISSGDPGIFAMASVFYESLNEGPDSWKKINFKVLPGITAMLAAASKVGAPLGHDFCVINLSDNLKPWKLIEKRIRLSIECDYVIAIYNPRSKARPDLLEMVLSIFKQTNNVNRYILFAKAVSTKKEKISLIKLNDAKPEMADMHTIVIIGSSKSKVIKINGKKIFYTPRSSN